MSGMIGGVLAACTVALVAASGALGQERPTTARSGVEMQFLDSRISAEERTVLETTVGYALPPLLEGAAWVSASNLDPTALRGQVVVIQSYTRGDADGRAALRRTEDILKNIKADGVQLIALHTPEDAKDSGAFYADKPPTTPTILDQVGAFCDELGVYQRPVTIMIDRSGRIRYPGVAMANLRPAVELLAAEPFDAGAPPPAVLPPRSTRIAEDAAPAPAGAPAQPRAADAEFPPIKGSVRLAKDVRGKQGPSLDRLVFMADTPQTEGRVVMLEFWATWCGPCVKNIPHLNELHEKFGDTVTIIGASDEDEQKIRGFMKTHEFQYPVARDMGGSIKNSIGVQGIPHAIIMSPDGIVRWQGHPGELDDKTIQQIVDASGAVPGGAPARPKRWVVQG